MTVHLLPDSATLTMLGGKKRLAHSGDNTGFNGAGTGGKGWGRQGVR